MMAFTEGVGHKDLDILIREPSDLQFKLGLYFCPSVVFTSLKQFIFTFSYFKFLLVYLFSFLSCLADIQDDSIC